MIAFAAARDHSERIVGAVVANTVIPGIDPWSKVIANPHIWHFAFHNIPKLPETLVSGHERSYFDFFFDLLAKNKEALDDDLRAELTRAYQRQEALSAGFDWYRAFEEDADHNSKHKPIELPLLYLRGDADGDIAEYAQGLRSAGASNLHTRVIANSGEYLPVEAPEEFCRALAEFRARIYSGAMSSKTS
jgi:pimeloyl-ACP methyl ester carboxylesterase